MAVFGQVPVKRFAINAQRVRNIGELSELLRVRFAAWPRDELIDVLEAAGVPCGPINSVADVFQGPQVQARGMCAMCRMPPASRSHRRPATLAHVPRDRRVACGDDR